MNSVKTYNSGASTNTNINGNGMFSPRGTTGDLKIQTQAQQGDDKMKLTKKPQGMIEEGETVPSPLIRKFKSAENGMTTNNSGIGLKDKVLKFHQDIVRGINISRSMGLNN